MPHVRQATRRTLHLRSSQRAWSSPMRPRAKRGAQTRERCVMARRHTAKLFGAAVALTASISGSQGQIALPPVDVNWTRLNSGMVGTATSIITSQDIESSPAQKLPYILSQQVGVQVQHLLSSTNGSRDAVDLRGFGGFAQSNMLWGRNVPRFS